MTTRTRAFGRALVYGAAALVLLGLALLRATDSSVLVEHSDSMAPALRVGDALLVRSVAAQDVTLGQVVTLQSAEVESTTHRVTEVAHRRSSVRLVTQGDANNSPEAWRLAPTAEVGSLVTRVPYAGYVLYWLGMPGVRVTLGVCAVLLLLPGRRPRPSRLFRRGRAAPCVP